MPLCLLNTNLPRAKVDESFARELSKHVANIVDRPEKVVTLQINPDQIMVRAGSTDPMAHVAVHGYNPDHFTDAMRVKWLRSLTSFLLEKLGIDDRGRIIVSFHPIEATHVGISGKLASEFK